MQLKQKYSIKKSLLRLLPLLMLATAPSCKKQPLPEPEPYDVVIDWNWETEANLAPPMNLIKKYAKDKYINTIFIHLTDPNSSGMSVNHFHKARDSLQTRIDVAPTRVRGMGTIFVSPTNGAQLADTVQDFGGMTISDSIWFTYHGWKVQRYNYGR